MAAERARVNRALTRRASIRIIAYYRLKRSPP